MAGSQALLLGLIVGSTLVAYPLFNSVKDTSLQALEDADHGGTVDDLPSWLRSPNDFPSDEELEYWNGRMPEGDEYGPDGDLDGDGIPNQEDPDADGDGKDDAEELRGGTDPAQWDDFDNGAEPPADDAPQRRLVLTLLWSWNMRVDSSGPVEDVRTPFNVGDFESIQVTVNVTDFQGDLGLGVRTPGGTPHLRSITLADSANTAYDHDETFSLLPEPGTWQGLVDHRTVNYDTVRIAVHGVRTEVVA